MIPRSQIIMNIVLLPVVFFVMFTISLLTIRVFNDVLSGRTQIESWEIERVRSLVRRRLTRNVDFPYDIDLWTNLTDSWGPVFTWLLPWGNALGDGLHFRKNEAADGGAVWPPDHKDQESPSTSGTATYKPTFVNMIHARYRGNRHPGDPNEFYRREQWENFEGEKLTDFGVDMDAEPSDTPGVVVDYSLADDDIPLQSLLNSRAADINATSPAHDGTSIT
jgi:palmitoyltransferase